MTLKRLLIRSIHMGRVVPELDPTISQMVRDKEVNLKNIKTRRNMGLTRLPILLEAAAETKIRNVADQNFRKELKKLMAIIHRFKLPDDRGTIELKKADLKTQLELRDKIKTRPEFEADAFRTTEDLKTSKLDLKQIIDGTVEEQRRDWHYYEYDEYASILYMALRLPSNYAAIKTVLNEIKDMNPDFEPKSVLDFGSGMGTTIWAVNETWPNSVQEFMNIDISKSQQQLCDYLLRGGSEFGPSPAGVFHRQYLPSSTKVKYDMVVAAYSLLEVPNAESRALLIENLWHKTNDLLILIERGTDGGFATINDARHFILDLSGHDVTRKFHFSSETQAKISRTLPKAHCLSPCPHEFSCPRATMTSKKRRNICRFRVVFEPLEVGEKKRGFIAEEFSYVVLRKQPHPSYLYENHSPRWPRVVEKRNHSSRQITQKLCCSNGSLAEATITQKRYGKEIFEVAKSCDWGDIFPVKIKDNYTIKSSFIDKKTQEVDKGSCDGSIGGDGDGDKSLNNSPSVST